MIIDALIFDEQQTATILAALRFYQREGQGDPAHRDEFIHKLATDGDRVISLDSAGIDELVEFIQSGNPSEDSDTQECQDCDDIVEEDDPFFATPCGTFCEGCMGGHVKVCGICKDEFEGDPNLPASSCATEGCDGAIDDGEGYDGYCGNCADRRERSRARQRKPHK